MYDVLTVCRYITKYCYLHNYVLTNLRLQKILYFIQLLFLITTGQPCFKNRMEAWDLGPVVPDAYHYYKKYGAGKIPGDLESEPDDIESRDRILIDFILEKLSKYSTYQLVQITHEQAPWHDCYVAYNSNEISLKKLKEFVDELKSRKK